MKTWPYLRAAAHVGALLPLLLLIFDALRDNLTANPIQAATQRSGTAALVLLLISLACTPLYTITGYAGFSRLRRPLGLYAFLYALVHLSIFLVLDYAFAWDLILPELAQKRYLIAGLAAFAILLALAATSFTVTMKVLGKNWKRLHRLVYAAGGLVVLHVAWAEKGNLSTLSGDILKPALALAVLLVLLGLRLPPIRRRLTALRRPPPRRVIRT